MCSLRGMNLSRWFLALSFFRHKKGQVHGLHAEAKRPHNTMSFSPTDTSTPHIYMEWMRVNPWIPSIWLGPNPSFSSIPPWGQLFCLCHICTCTWGNSKDTWDFYRFWERNYCSHGAFFFFSWCTCKLSAILPSARTL